LVQWGESSRGHHEVIPTITSRAGSVEGYPVLFVGDTVQALCTSRTVVCIAWAVKDKITISRERLGFSSITINPIGGTYKRRYKTSVTSMSISGEEDGRLQEDTFLALGQEDDLTSMWYIGSRSSVHYQPPRTDALQGYEQPVLALTFRGNATLISGSAGGELFLWRYAKSPVSMERWCRRKVLKGHVGPVRAVAIHPTGRSLSSGGEDDMVRLWDTYSGECLHVLSGHESQINDVSFSHSGTFIATCSGSLRAEGYMGNPRSDVPSTPLVVGGDNTVKIWHVSGGNLEASHHSD
jgi:WD40 repeat protein